MSWGFLVFWFAVTVCICMCLCAPGDEIVFPHDDDNGHHVKPEPDKIPLVSNGKSAEMCKKYSEFVFIISETPKGEKVKIDTCVSVEPRIADGTWAQPREFPHMALIGFPTKHPLNSKRWSCGGSLISERYVLSAAHCTSLNGVRAKYVRLGDYDYRSTKDDDVHNARTVEFEIVEIIVHPEYDSHGSRNDIALYKLDRNVEFNDYMRPICLHTEHQLFRNNFIITGWGHVQYGEQGDGVLQKGNLSYVPRKECSSYLNKHIKDGHISVNDSTMLCADAGFASKTSSCQGDSGGPLQYPLIEPYCMYSQVGILSFGLQCGYGHPEVYTRVSYFVPWIERIVWP